MSPTVLEPPSHVSARAPAGWRAGWDAPRTAIATIFLLDGLTFGVWVAHLPLLKRALALSDLAFAAALAGLVAGAFVAQPLAGLLASRVGSRRVTRIASVCAGCALALPAFAPTLATLVAATIVLGLARGATEVPMNAQATLLETQHARPRMSSFHACFSLGGFLGAGAAALLLHFGAGARATLPGVGLSCAAIAFFVGRSLLRDTPRRGHMALHDGAPPTLAALARDRTLVLLGVLAFCGLFGEGAMADWSALLLERNTGAAAAAAAVGYAVFSVAMTCGRVTGDAVIARAGRSRTLRASGVLAATGMVLALIGSYPVAVAGFAIVGLGYANLVPILFSASGRHGGSAGISAVSTLGYAGFVVGPPAIGALSQATGSLAAALSAVAVFAAVIAVGAGAVEREP
ncbi:MAG: MFS transporter [bacterium]